MVFGAFSVMAQDAAVPPELDKTFDRYSRAWTHADWGRVYDLTSPAIQNILLRDFKSRDGWIKHQSEDFKDTINELERKGVFRMSETVYTFAIITHGKRPKEAGGESFEVPGYASFQLFAGKWYLIDPVMPKQALPAKSATMPARK